MIRSQSQFAIWDLDNCLSDDRGRIRLIDWSQDNPDLRYNPYHAGCANDRCHNLDVFTTISQLARPVFFTSRPEAVRAETTRWIRCELDLQQPIIIMRPEKDHTPSLALKTEMLAQYIDTMLKSSNGMQPCFAAFDDREDIVDMYRWHGIDAAILNIHSVCAYTPPKELS